MIRILAFLSLYILSDITLAQAYIDPNTGGYVFQFLFPIVAAVGAGYLFCKNQVKRLLQKVGNLFKR